MTFYQRYIELCNKIGKAPSAVATEIGLTKTAVNRWKNGSNPTDATASKIASYFNVTVDFMMGLEEAEKEEKKEQSTESELSIKKKEFIQKIANMSDAQIERLEQILALVEKTDL